MKKLLSYAVHGNNPRYLHNIPYILIANSLIYPDFSMRFYVHQNSIHHPFVTLLQKINEQLKEVEVEIVTVPLLGNDYMQTWRMKPLWEINIDYLFCRDIDYALSSLERKCVDYFLAQNECIVHSIRACGHHNSVFLAGLCGFNVKKVFDKIKKYISSFSEYISYGEKNVPWCKGKVRWRYGADQSLLEKFIKTTGLEEFILDCPLQDSVLHSLILPRTKVCVSSEYQDLQISFCDSKILDFIDFLYGTPTKWINLNPFIGRAWTCNSESLKKLIILAANKMSNLVEKILVDSLGNIAY